MFPKTAVCECTSSDPLSLTRNSFFLSCLVSLAVALLTAYLTPATATAEFGLLTKWGGFCSVYEQGIEGCNGNFDFPAGMALDPSGNVYVADSDNDRIQKFDSNGGFITKWGIYGSDDGQFDRPSGVAVGSSGNVYVVDADNDRIQKFNSSGSHIASWGGYGSSENHFRQPLDIAVDSTGSVYVADADNHRIQKFSSDDSFQSMWGWGVSDGSPEFQVCIDNCQAGIEGSNDRQFDLPSNVAVDPFGNVYVANAGNARIQKLGSNGDFITRWNIYDLLLDIAVSQSANVYVSKRFAVIDRLLKFDSNGVKIPMGNNQWDMSLEGPSYGIAVDLLDNVYASDSEGDQIQKFGEVATRKYPFGPRSRRTKRKRSSRVRRNQRKVIDSKAYRSSCNLRITSPKLKINKSKFVTKIAAKKSKRKSHYVRLSAKTASRLFRRRVKGHFTWGKVDGKRVKCEKAKMAILQKRGKRYYVPGTKTRVTGLSAMYFKDDGRKFLIDKKVGKLKQKRVSKKRKTNFSYRNFSRKTRLGRRALRNLKKRRYRGTYVVIYTAQVDGIFVKKTLTLRVKK